MSGHAENIIAARRRRRRPSHSLSLNLTSMIDVTFLLLIYFVACTRFVVGEETYRTDLPQTLGSGPAADPFELDEEPLTIRVATRMDDERIPVLRIDGTYPQPDSVAALHEFLAARIIGGTGEGLFAADHPIVIVPASSARWQHALEVFNAAARAGFTNLTLAKPG